MIDLREIRETIDEIKRNGNTVSQAERLALLYLAADHMEREEKDAQERYVFERGYSQAAELLPKTVEVDPKSEFLSACNGAPIEGVLNVLDDHMDAIAVLYPKEYEAILQKIEELK